MRLFRVPFRAVAAAAVLLAFPVAGRAADRATAADVRRGLDGLVAASGGPPGAVATLYRNGRLTVLRAGRADIGRKGAPRATQHMRIASVAKAFSGAVALRLVRDGRLGLDDTIGQRVIGMPSAWAGVSVRQLLNHTSGLPDYTQSDAFAKQALTDPRGFVSPTGIIDWVRGEPLVFAPGSRYAYSNTDNIVIGLIAQAVTGRAYPDLLADFVFGPARLRETSFPTRRISLPAPFVHGYG
jgi:D-alanyl-D-alanine carboxypeptidase